MLYVHFALFYTARMRAASGRYLMSESTLLHTMRTLDPVEPSGLGCPHPSQHRLGNSSYTYIVYTYMTFTPVITLDS